MFDSVTILALFVAESNPELVLTIACAFLFQMIPFYFHSVREILIVYAVIEHSRDRELADLIVALFKPHDTIAFQSRISRIFECIRVRMEKRMRFVPKPANELVDAISGNASAEVQTIIVQDIMKARELLVSLGVTAGSE